MGGIDRRVRYLKKRLEVLKVVSTTPTDPNEIYFGAWVVLEDEDGNEQRFRIVGPDEFDPEKSWISMDSPMAQALMGKAVDSEVVVKTPTGIQERYVVSVSYSG